MADGTALMLTPYVGLRPFDEADALLFFGRDQHVDDLVAKLSAKQHFTAVVGPSGSGKSSLVRAGLIPALRQGKLGHSAQSWNIHICKPGNTPIANLAEELAKDSRWLGGEQQMPVAALAARLAATPLALTELYQRGNFGGEAILLVIDQFEEIFRYRQSDEAVAFVNLLLASSQLTTVRPESVEGQSQGTPVRVSESSASNVPIYVVITMRSDFLGNCTTFYGLPEAINDGLYLTPRLTREQLRTAIVAPLALVSSSIDNTLVPELINSLQGEDELPVLQHALLRMWHAVRTRGSSRIARDAFLAAGALTQSTGLSIEASSNADTALDRHASEIYSTLTPMQQKLARRVFLSLAERRDGRDVRRYQTFADLRRQVGQANETYLRAVIEAFRAQGVGFLLPSEPRAIGDITPIDISHESLIRQWCEFQTWLAEEDAAVAELKEWSQRLRRKRHGEGGWLDAEDARRATQWCRRIESAGEPEEWVDRFTPGREVSFAQIRSYVSASNRELTRVQRERERFQKEKQEAEVHRLEAEARLQREVAQRAETDKLRAEAHALDSRRKTRVATTSAVIAVVAFLCVAVAAYWANQQANHARAMTREALARHLMTKAETLGMQYPDTSRLLALAALRSNPASIDAAGFVRVASRWGYPLKVFRHPTSVKYATFSLDGKTVLTVSRDNTVRLWDLASAREPRVLRGHEARVSAAQFSPDGKTVLTRSDDTTTRLWEVRSGRQLQVLRGNKYPVSEALFSPDGQTVVTVDGALRMGSSKAGNVRLWTVASGTELLVLHGHEKGDGGSTGQHNQSERRVLAARFSPDGKTVLTASEDKTARLWDVKSGRALHVLRGHAGSVLDAVFSPDGTTVLTRGADNTAGLWDVRSGRQQKTLGGREHMLSEASFSPDGKMVLTLSRDDKDRTARLWDVVSGRPLHILRGHDNSLLGALFSPDGKAVLSASKDGTARLWDAESGEELQVMRGKWGDNWRVRFSPDGKSVVMVGGDKTATLWDVESGKELQVFVGHEDSLTEVQFSPDGRTVLTASIDGEVRLWSCEICRPASKIAQEMQIRIGRYLTLDEQKRFGVPDQLLSSGVSIESTE